MGKVQIISNPLEFRQQINDGVKIQLDNFLEEFKPKQPNEYLTRKEVALLFKVDISTIHNWCKSKRLKPLGIGSRVYFLRSDIEQSLTPLSV
jgi:predicted DNA-binding transcriptional regulator AlpA